MIHRQTHPNLDDPTCFACRISSMKFILPTSFRSVGKGDNKYDNADTYDQMKRELNETLKNDREGRFQKV